MDEYYKILGVSPDADNDAIEDAYLKLRAKYAKDRFLEGEAGNIAAKNLTKLDEAYEEILSFREEMTVYRKDNSEANSNSDFGGATLLDVSDAITAGNLKLAQEKLDEIQQKDAEWHYLQSVVFYKKNWVEQSKQQLEIALQMDPGNQKYVGAHAKVVAKLNYANSQYADEFHSGNANYNTQKQMGGDGCLDFCTAYCCAEIMCSLCCGH